jgi:signal peptidase I
MMFFRWLTSGTVRNACTLRKHVWNLRCAQRDILAPKALASLDTAVGTFDAVLHSNANNQMLTEAMQQFETDALKWIKPYPNSGWRENVEVLLVAVGVAMAVRTFFIQPFKIPTGSMQPTLFGVMSTSLIGDQSFTIPTGWARIKEWFEGVSYVHEVAQEDGQLLPVDPPKDFYGRPQVITDPVKFLIFNICQSYKIVTPNNTTNSHMIWFPPDLGEAQFELRTPLDPNRTYHKGEDIIKLRVTAGDHLFVDRLTYNFRKPERGEIAVFITQGIHNSKMPQDEFYIKRLCVMPGERVQIGNDRHMIINGVRLDKNTPHFENVYGFDPKVPPRVDTFCGHVNGFVNAEYTYLYPDLAPLFPDQDTVYTNGPDSYMVFGDNTCNSFDSRAWGPFPTGNVIGKSWFVYWPFTSRFGWGNR